MTAKSPPKGKALVILSGGQDSTTCLYWAKQNFEDLVAITFSYGQRHIVEIESAKKIAARLGVKHQILDLGTTFDRVSSLTDPERALAEQPAQKGKSQLPSTFVPGRNIVFLAIAAGRAFVESCDTLVVGVSQEDFAGYPDCRANFISSMETALQAGLDNKIKICAPLLHLSKKQTVELAMNLPGCMDALAFSTTCYEGSTPPCEVCNACVLRAKGFREAGLVDPLLQRTECLSETV